MRVNVRGLMACEAFRECELRKNREEPPPGARGDSGTRALLSKHCVQSTIATGLRKGGKDYERRRAYACHNDETA
jgi:hypothetical protein